MILSEAGLNTELYTLVSSERLTANVSLLRFSGNTEAITTPGQFAAVSLPGFFLRRPFSVFDWGPGWLELLVEKAGQGTFLLQETKPGSRLEIMTGLGNGFSLESAGDAPLLIGGGTGLSPLLALAKHLSALCVAPKVLLGFRSSGDVCCLDRFTAYTDCLTVYTDDGSFGLRGLVTDSDLLQSCGKFYACGPRAMLRTLCARCEAPGELSLDVRMGCGFGACMGCSIRTASGMKRVCKDGPVFQKEELLWDD